MCIYIYPWWLMRLVLFNSLVIRDMQIKTTMNAPTHTVEWLKLKWQYSVLKRMWNNCWVNAKMPVSHLDKHTPYMTYIPGISFVGICPAEMSISPHKCLYTNFHSSFSTTGKKRETIQMINNWWINKVWYTQTKELFHQ